MRHLLAFPLLLLSLYAPRAAARCDATALADGVAQVRAGSPSSQVGLSALALSRACTFAAPIQQSLIEVQTAPRDRLAAIDRRTVTAAQDAWNLACPGGLDALAAALPKGPAEAHALVYERCAADRLGFATAAEFGAATGSLALPILVGYQLHAENQNPDHVRVLVQALAGVAAAP